jgi:hypothetical protein
MFSKVVTGRQADRHLFFGLPMSKVIWVNDIFCEPTMDFAESKEVVMNDREQPIQPPGFATDISALVGTERHLPSVERRLGEV